MGGAAYMIQKMAGKKDTKQNKLTSKKTKAFKGLRNTRQENKNSVHKIQKSHSKNRNKHTKGKFFWEKNS